MPLTWKMRHSHWCSQPPPSFSSHETGADAHDELQQKGAHTVPKCCSPRPQGHVTSIALRSPRSFHTLKVGALKVVCLSTWGSDTLRGKQSSSAWTTHGVPSSLQQCWYMITSPYPSTACFRVSQSTTAWKK